MSVKRFSLALVLCAAMAFTACDKEGGNQSGPDTDPVTPTENTVDVAYAIGGGADFLLIFDAEVTYTDAAGKTATEKISSLPWSKELTGLALPYTAKMEITLTARERTVRVRLRTCHLLRDERRPYLRRSERQQTDGRQRQNSQISGAHALQKSPDDNRNTGQIGNSPIPQERAAPTERPSLFSRNRSYRTAAGFIILQKREAMRRCRRMASFLFIP